jgi:hypothetical protein
MIDPNDMNFPGHYLKFYLLSSIHRLPGILSGSDWDVPAVKSLRPRNMGWLYLMAMRREAENID